MNSEMFQVVIEESTDVDAHRTLRISGDLKKRTTVEEARRASVELHSAIDALLQAYEQSIGVTIDHADLVIVPTLGGSSFSRIKLRVTL